MLNENSMNKDLKGVGDSALENLTKLMLKTINNSKSPSKENLNVNELKKTIKDLIENSELDYEDN